jgi:polyphosphate kinase 2
MRFEIGGPDRSGEQERISAMGEKRMGKKHKGSAASEGFEIEAPELHEGIDKAAMTSGDYPYDRKMDRDEYEETLRRLQIELLKLETWTRDKGERIVILFEGRDGAGKGGTIHRFTQHLNPRGARVVALSKPSDREAGQWYFQRYAEQLPTRGEMTFFDRSWYNRAGVERVMGFSDKHQVRAFLTDAPVFEELLVRDGVRLVKFFLTIGREMQMKRLHARYHDPLKRWKLSPIDFKALARWDDYSDAFDQMFAATDTAHAPWTIIRANDKLRARIDAIRHVLAAMPYKDKDTKAIGKTDPNIVINAATYLRRGGEE